MAGVTTYTQEMADLICEGLAEGNSLRTVCKADHMPSLSTVFKWLREQEVFSHQYARAKEEAADALFDDIQDIADDGTNDWMEKQNQEGENIGWQVNGECLQRSRLRVDTRKWMMSKMKPKKYGDRQTVEHEVLEDGVEVKLELAISRAAGARSGE